MSAISPQPQAATSTPPGLNRRLADDLVLQAPTVLLGTVVLYVVNLLYYAELLPTSMLLAWTLFIALNCVLRAGLVLDFRRAPERVSAKTWIHRVVIISALLGCSWSFFAVWVVLSLPPEYGVVAIITSTGVVGSAATTSSASPWSYRALAYTLLVPLTTALLLSGDGAYRAVGVLSICYLVVLSRAASRVHTTLYQSVTFGLENEVLAQKLERQSNIDSLTGLLNRRALNQGFESAWKDGLSSQTSVGLVLCDVDYFKQYNDSLGHLAGDQCLQQVAAALQSVTRSTDQVTARYGGEEFAVLIPESTEEILRQVSERIQRTILELRIPHPNSKVGEYVTVSTGASQLLPEPNRLITQLVNQADNALYRAKASGRNRTWVFDELEAGAFGVS